MTKQILVFGILFFVNSSFAAVKSGEMTCNFNAFNRQDGNVPPRFHDHFVVDLITCAPDCSDDPSGTFKHQYVRKGDNIDVSIEVTQGPDGDAWLVIVPNKLKGIKAVNRTYGFMGCQNYLTHKNDGSSCDYSNVQLSAAEYLYSLDCFVNLYKP